MARAESRVKQPRVKQEKQGKVQRNKKVMDEERRKQLIKDMVKRTNKRGYSALTHLMRAAKQLDRATKGLELFKKDMPEMAASSQFVQEWFVGEMEDVMRNVDNVKKGLDYVRLTVRVATGSSDGDDSDEEKDAVSESEEEKESEQGNKVQ